jgi:hypothetical protein
LVRIDDDERKELPPERPPDCNAWASHGFATSSAPAINDGIILKLGVIFASLGLSLHFPFTGLFSLLVLGFRDTTKPMFAIKNKMKILLIHIFQTLILFLMFYK